MSQNFECFVQISDQKYDLIIENQSLSMKFCDIYPKVQQIVKIGLREDINFITHMFEVFNNCSQALSTVVTNGDQLILDQSLISITPKPLSTSLSVPSLASALTQSKSCGKRLHRFLKLKESEDYLIKSVIEIESYRKIVLTINIGWDLKQFKDWNRVSMALNDKQLNTCKCNNSFFYWTKYYAKNYDILNNQIESNPQKIFDLLKVVHTIDLNQIYSGTNGTAKKIKDISNYPEFKQFFEKNLREIRSEKLKSINKVYISRTPIKWSTNNNSSVKEKNPVQSPLVSPSTPTRSSGQTLNRSTDRSDRAVSSSSSTPIIKQLPKNSDETNLKLNENEIKNFHRIVLAINIGWFFIDDKTADINWSKVSQTISKYAFDSIYCKNKFFFWSRFYALNYDKLNGNLQPEYQQVFDYLKVVHTLNLERLYNKTNEIIKIKDISTKIELKEYFAKNLSSIRKKKEETAERYSIWKNTDRPVAHFHLRAYHELCLEQFKDDLPVNRGNNRGTPFSTERSNRSYNSITDYSKRLFRDNYLENRTESIGHRNDRNVSKISPIRLNNNLSKTVSQSTQPSDPRLKRAAEKRSMEPLVGDLKSLKLNRNNHKVVRLV